MGLDHYDLEFSEEEWCEFTHALVDMMIGTCYFDKYKPQYASAAALLMQGFGDTYYGCEIGNAARRLEANFTSEVYTCLDDNGTRFDAKYGSILLNSTKAFLSVPHNSTNCPDEPAP